MLKVYDTIIIGSGPAGISAAIYAARKGLDTALVGIYVGGQVLDTNEIENIIGISSTNGFDFSMKLEEHLNNYEVKFFKGNNVVKLEKNDSIFNIHLDSNEIINSKTVILATGAKWRELNVKGEKEFLGRGVHYCSTCDGPFYRNKDVVIVGGGNSGVEAALELSNIANKVTLIEYMSSLKADKVLVDKLYSNSKIDVITSTKISELKGNIKLENIDIINVEDNEMKNITVDGVFVEIGLSANTSLVKDLVVLNAINEIIIDENNMSSLEGLFAAGDCSNTKHKQIVIAMGEGAKAALNVFEYLLKNNK